MIDLIGDNLGTHLHHTEGELILSLDGTEVIAMIVKESGTIAIIGTTGNSIETRSRTSLGHLSINSSIMSHLESGHLEWSIGRTPLR